MQIKFLPRHRKIKLIITEISKVTCSSSQKQNYCECFISAAIVQDLLQSEFVKPRERQSISTLNLYVNLLLDLAEKENSIDRQLEKILLSANNMNVISDYYYLVANLLRLKVSLIQEKTVQVFNFPLFRCLNATNT